MESIIKISGIYKIENKTTGDIYIGSSKTINSRFASHLSLLRNNKHQNNYLQNSWNKYGEENFVMTIVELCDEELLVEKEQYYIDILNPSFNITKEVVRNIPSEESRLKHSITKKKMFEEGIIPKFNTKEIYQYNLDGNFVKKFDSIADACKELQCHPSGINRCARGIYEQQVGFQWKYTYCGEKISETHNKRKKQHTLNLYRFVNIHTNEEFLMNIFDIEKTFNINRYNLYQYIHKKFIFRKTYQIFKTDQKITIDLIKLSEFRETPEVDNPEPSINLND